MKRKTQTSLDKNQNETTTTNSYHILIADYCEEMRVLLTLSLRKAGYIVTECHNGMDLLMYLTTFILPNEIGYNIVDLIISDIRIPGLLGLEILGGVPKKEEVPPIILITAFGDEEIYALAKEHGAAAMFDKPFDMDCLLAKVHELLTLNEKSRV